MSGTTPAWIAGLSDPVIQADALLLAANGVQTVTLDLKLLDDVVAELAAGSGSTLTAAQLKDLQSVALNVSSPPPYVVSGAYADMVFDSNGNDDLQVGFTAAQVTATVEAVFPSLSNVSDPALHADLASLAASPTLAASYSAILQMLNDLTGEITASATHTMTASQATNLAYAVQYSAQQLSLSAQTASLLTQLIQAPSTGTWTGGATSWQLLGNVAGGISAADFSQLVSKYFLGGDMPSPQLSDAGAGYSYKAFSLPLFGSSGQPAAADVQQGKVGDGNLLAVLIDETVTNPALLKSMLVDDGNNVYGVSYYNLARNQTWLTVNNLLPVDSSGALLYNAGAVNWANLIEKAYAQTQISGAAISSTTINSYAYLNGVDYTEAFGVITGSAAYQVADYASQDTHWAQYKTLFVKAIAAQDSLIVTETGVSSNSSGNELFVGDQSYAVLGYDATTGDFILRNPEGDRGTSLGHVAQFEASMADIAAVGGTIVINNTANQVAVAAALAGTGVAGPVVVHDSAANVFANLDALQGLILTGGLSSVGLTDSTAVTATLTQSQLANDSGVLANIVGNFSLTITGVSAANAASVADQPNVSQIMVVDSSAAVGVNIDTLETLASDGQCTAITLTDGASGHVVLTDAQLTNDQDALSLLQGKYSLTVSGVSIAAMASVLAQSDVTQVAISDLAANVSANLDSLQSLASSGQLASVTLSDGGIPTITVTAAQLASDASVLKAITSSYDTVVTAPSTSAAITGVAGLGTTIDINGTSSQYSFTATASHSLTITGNGATYTISGAQAVQFNDNSFIVASATETPGSTISSAQITELYGAVFGRLPDVGGLGYYEQTAAKNPAIGFLTYAEYFLSSPEYTGNSAHAYAQNSTGDAQFITDSYTNLLARAPEAGAVSYYQTNVINPIIAADIAAGQTMAQAELHAHAQVLVYFSQSPEFIGDVSSTGTGTPAFGGHHWLLLV